MKFGKVATRALLVGVSLSTVALVALPGVSQAKKVKGTTYYVSLGDSYSVGYQPLPVAGATSGYTGYVASKLKMTLVNFGCGGATTDSILTFTGVCGVDAFGPPAATNAGTIPPGQSQVQAADNFITAHAGHIGLITVSIGGNDVTPCANAPDPIACVGAGITAIQTHVGTLVNDLHTAAGSSVPIVGITYPDVLLGLWVHPTFPASAANQLLATESIGVFGGFINPALKIAYTSVTNGRFVDVTTATGANIPFTKLMKVAPYGKIPKAVGLVCKFTWYCQLGNIHANTVGYTEIGKLIKKAAK